MTVLPLPLSPKTAMCCSSTLLVGMPGTLGEWSDSCGERDGVRATDTPEHPSTAASGRSSVPGSRR